MDGSPGPRGQNLRVEASLLRDKTLGSCIVADEARTFCIAALFKRSGFIQRARWANAAVLRLLLDVSFPSSGRTNLEAANQPARGSCSLLRQGEPLAGAKDPAPGPIQSNAGGNSTQVN